jgi:putative Holliday junction resolvase
MPEDGAAGALARVRSAPPLLALAFDYGERRLGVAAGDTLTNSARPLGTVPAAGGVPDWAAIGRYLGDWQPQCLVVGVPRNMDGSDGRLTAPARAFAAELAARYGIEVATVDERLSSREAEDILRRRRASGARARRVRRGDVDPVAACVLLEQWLRGRDTAPPGG